MSKLSIGLALALLVQVSALAAGQADLPSQQADPQQASRAAVERAVPLMQRSARVWTQETNCFSCHHQGLGQLALGLLRERGFALDESARSEELDAIRDSASKRFLSLLACNGVGVFGRATTLIALGAGGRPRDDVTDATAHFLASRQAVCGAWYSNEHRPPIEDSAVSATAWTARALALYGPEGRAAEMQGRLASARAWLERVVPRDNEERCLQLLGLAWTGVEERALASRARDLLALQRADGGWAQLDTRASDAYATGQALVVLHQLGGLATDAEPWRRGVSFLLASQAQDGSWHLVTRRRIKGQPQVDSGFPYGEDQFGSYAASAWALMALALDGAPPQRSAALFGAAPERSKADATAAENGVDELLHAAAFGTLEQLDEVLRSGADPGAIGPHGLTALALSVHDPRKVERLLAEGAAPDASGDWGLTPLLMASLTAGAHDSVALLLERGASVECRAVNGAVPLFGATSRGDFETVELLLRAGARFEPALLSTALVYSANCGDVDSARALLALGAPIDTPSLQGHTPLTAAAIAGYEDCLRLFLEAGADPDVAGAEGLTALAWAAKVDPGHSRIVSALLAAGAEPKRGGAGQPTPLELALTFGNAHHVELLRD